MRLGARLVRFSALTNFYTPNGGHSPLSDPSPPPLAMPCDHLDLQLDLDICLCWCRLY